MDHFQNKMVFLDYRDLESLIEGIIEKEMKKLDEKLNKPSRILTREEAADKLGVSPNTVSNYVRQGLITNRGVGRRILILERELENTPRPRKLYSFQ